MSLPWTASVWAKLVAEEEEINQSLSKKKRQRGDGGIPEI